jgi:O-antigen ligase
MTLAAMLIALQFNTNLDPRQLELGLKTYALISVVLLIIYAIGHRKAGLRLGDETKSLGSNAIGVMCVSAVLAAAAVRTLAIRIPLMASAGFILYLTGSRASSVFMIIGLTLILLSRIKTLTTWQKIALAGFALAAIIVSAYSLETLEHFFSNFFALHDEWRGVKSGATGRKYAWLATWNLFTTSPLIGVGFRAHEQMIRIASSSHNGYLALLAEIGIIGFCGALALITRGIAVLWKNLKSQETVYANSIFFGLCIGYLILGIFERYLINVGNPASLLFIIGILTYES